MVNLIGLRSNQECHASPANLCLETRSNAGASASSSVTALPDLMVAIIL